MLLNDSLFGIFMIAYDFVVFLFLRLRILLSKYALCTYLNIHK